MDGCPNVAQANEEVTIEKIPSHNNKKKKTDHVQHDSDKETPKTDNQMSPWNRIKHRWKNPEHAKLTDWIMTFATVRIFLWAGLQLMEMWETRDRPDVFLSKITIESFEEGQEPTYLICFVNSGQRSARNTRIRIDSSWAAEPIVISGLKVSANQGPFFIGAGAELCMPIGSGGKTLAKTDNIDSDVRTYRVWGTIIYDDPIIGKDQKNYAAKYIKWKKPRPDWVPSFYILNDSPIDADPIVITP